MLTIHCPNCGITAEETEFHAGGEAHLKRFGPGSTDADFESYLFMRNNPKGVHFERWRHNNGCGKWFHIARNTTTLEVFGSYSAQTYSPPQHILDAISDRGADWTPEGHKS